MVVVSGIFRIVPRRYFSKSAENNLTALVALFCNVLFLAPIFYLLNTVVAVVFTLVLVFASGVAAGGIAKRQRDFLLPYLVVDSIAALILCNEVINFGFRKREISPPLSFMIIMVAAIGLVLVQKFRSLLLVAFIFVEWRAPASLSGDGTTGQFRMTPDFPVYESQQTTEQYSYPRNSTNRRKIGFSDIQERPVVSPEAIQLEDEPYDSSEED